MRDPERIEPFLNRIGELWRTNCPDYRFGQLIENVFGEMEYTPWMLEEDRMLEEFEKYFGTKPQKKGRKKGHGREKRK